MAATKKTILLVEDDEFLAELYATKLNLEGFEVLLAADGEKGFKMARDKRPDLILLDIILPGMSGLDILKELKESEETKNIKVVMLTNFGTDENVSRATELGSDDYLMKYNVVPSELPDKIASLLGVTPESGIKVIN